MGAFEYVALDKSGKQTKGLLEGDTPKHVRQLLRDRSLIPVSVTVTISSSSSSSSSIATNGWF